MNIQSVFIGGVGRCGTSVTREMFSCHPKVISFPFEYRFIIDPDGIVDFINSNSISWSPFLYDKRIKRLEYFLYGIGRKSLFKYSVGKIIRSVPKLKGFINSEAYHGWELERFFPNYNQHVSKLMSELCQFKYKGSWVGAESYKMNDCINYSYVISKKKLYSIFSRFLNDLFGELMILQKKNILVEDNTWNMLFIRELDQLFQGAKFIHVYRDPRDIVCSFVNQRWMPKNVYQSSLICADLYKRIFDNINMIDNTQIIEISIEELVENKGVIVNDLFEFAKLEITESIKHFPLSNSSFGKWKNILDYKDLDDIEPVLRGITEKLGYTW